MNLPHNHRLQLGHLDAVREARRAAEAEKTKDEHAGACNHDGSDKIAPDDVGTGTDGQWKLWRIDTHTVTAGPGPDGAVSIAQHTIGFPAKLAPEQAHTLARVLDTAASSLPNLKPPAEGTEN